MTRTPEATTKSLAVMAEELVRVLALDNITINEYFSKLSSFTSRPDNRDVEVINGVLWIMIAPVVYLSLVFLFGASVTCLWRLKVHRSRVMLDGGGVDGDIRREATTGEVELNEVGGNFLQARPGGQVPTGQPPAYGESNCYQTGATKARSSTLSGFTHWKRAGGRRQMICRAGLSHINSYNQTKPLNDALKFQSFPEYACLAADKFQQRNACKSEDFDLSISASEKQLLEISFDKPQESAQFNQHICQQISQTPSNIQQRHLCQIHNDLFEQDNNFSPPDPLSIVLFHQQRTMQCPCYQAHDAHTHPSWQQHQQRCFPNKYHGVENPLFAPDNEHDTCPESKSAPLPHVDSTAGNSNRNACRGDEILQEFQEEKPVFPLPLSAGNANNECNAHSQNPRAKAAKFHGRRTTRIKGPNVSSIQMYSVAKLTMRKSQRRLPPPQSSANTSPDIKEAEKSSSTFSLPSSISRFHASRVQEHVLPPDAVYPLTSTYNNQMVSGKNSSDNIGTGSSGPLHFRPGCGQGRSVSVSDLYSDNTSMLANVGSSVTSVSANTASSNFSCLQGNQQVSSTASDPWGSLAPVQAPHLMPSLLQSHSFDFFVQDNAFDSQLISGNIRTKSSFTKEILNGAHGTINDIKPEQVRTGQISNSADTTVSENTASFQDNKEKAKPERFEEKDGYVLMSGLNDDDLPQELLNQRVLIIPYSNAPRKTKDPHRETTHSEMPQHDPHFNKYPGGICGELWPWNYRPPSTPHNPFTLDIDFGNHAAKRQFPVRKGGNCQTKIISPRVEIGQWQPMNGENLFSTVGRKNNPDQCQVKQKYIPQCNRKVSGNPHLNSLCDRNVGPDQMTVRGSGTYTNNSIAYISHDHAPSICLNDLNLDPPLGVSAASMQTLFQDQTVEVPGKSLHCQQLGEHHVFAHPVVGNQAQEKKNDQSNDKNNFKAGINHDWTLPEDPASLDHCQKASDNLLYFDTRNSLDTLDTSADKTIPPLTGDDVFGLFRLTPDLKLLSYPLTPLMTPLMEEAKRATSKFVWGESDPPSFTSSTSSIANMWACVDMECNGADAHHVEIGKRRQRKLDNDDFRRQGDFDDSVKFHGMDGAAGPANASRTGDWGARDAVASSRGNNVTGTSGTSRSEITANWDSQEIGSKNIVDGEVKSSNIVTFEDALGVASD